MRDSHGMILRPAKKRTKLKSTKASLCRELQKYQCQCPEGTHQHVRGKAGRDLQNYPAKLCRLLAKELSDVEIDHLDANSMEESVETVETLDVEDGHRLAFTMAYHMVLDDVKNPPIDDQMINETAWVTEDGEKDFEGK